MVGCWQAMKTARAGQLNTRTALCESGGTVVGLDETAESFTAADRAVQLRSKVGIEDAVADALCPAGAFGKIVCDPRRDNVIHLPEREDSEVVEGLGFEPRIDIIATSIVLP